jgi:hypothetical protein
MPGGIMEMGKLIVDGVERKLGADFSLRFVDGDLVTLVLYYRGKRVTKSWEIELVYKSPKDPDENANTADF